MLASELEGNADNMCARVDPGFLKLGVNFCNNVREIKYYFNIRGIRKKRNKRAQKGGVKISLNSPPLDPRLA